MPITAPTKNQTDQAELYQTVADLLRKSPLIKTETERLEWLEQILPQADESQLNKLKQILLDAEKVVFNELEIISQEISGLMQETKAATLLANEEKSEQEDAAVLNEIAAKIQNA